MMIPVPPAGAAGPNKALGEFLRSRRERLDPMVLGTATLRRRRTPGLRREEIADAAGISVEWYVKLEQGRAVAPPAATLAALARAFGLDAVETAHLRRLAGAASHEMFVRERVPAGLRRMLKGLPQPAYIMGRRWDMLAWNEAASDLFGDIERIPATDRNILSMMLVRPYSKALFGDRWASEARRMVALFRATYDLWRDDPSFIALVSHVEGQCPNFAGWWRDHAISAPVSGLKILHTPAGKRRYEYASFQANDDPALRLALYTEL